MGRMDFRSGTASAATESKKSAVQGGRLYIPPAYMHTSADMALPLSSAADKCAFAFTPEIDFELNSLSFYVHTVSTAGNMAIDLHEDDGTVAPHSNGDLNGNNVNCAPVMTSNSSPSQPVVGLFDNSGANAEVAGYEAYKAMNGSTAADDGLRSNAAPTSGSPVHFTIDFGVGNGVAVNKFRFISFNNSDANIRAYPRAFTFWGSNSSNPAPQTDSDWIQLTGSIVWTADGDPGAAGGRSFNVNNATAYRHYRIRITDRNGTNAYTSIGEIQFFAASSKPVPGGLVSALGLKAVGPSSGVWLRHTFTGVQLQRGKRYWLQFTGSAAADFSLSAKRSGATKGSDFPDSTTSDGNRVALKKTSDSGSTWTAVLQDSNKPAMLNAVLNSDPDHLPQLHYGRYDRMYVHIPGKGTVAIPQTGLVLGNSGFIASDTSYCVHCHDNGGLALGVSDSGPTLTSGTETCPDSSYPDNRFLGMVACVERITGHHAPIDVKDCRYVLNRHNRIAKPFGKTNPYAALTRAYGNIQNDWVPWYGDDWKCFLIADGSTATDFVIGNAAPNGTYYMVAVAVDGNTAKDTGLYLPAQSGNLRLCHVLSPGVRMVEPVMMWRNNTTGLDLYVPWTSGFPTTYSAIFEGTVQC